MMYLEDDEISIMARALVADAISVYGHQVYDRFNRVAAKAGIKITIDEIDQDSLDAIINEFANTVRNGSKNSSVSR